MSVPKKGFPSSVESFVIDNETRRVNKELGQKRKHNSDEDLLLLTHVRRQNPISSSSTSQDETNERVDAKKDGTIGLIPIHPDDIMMSTLILYLCNELKRTRGFKSIRPLKQICMAGDVLSFENTLWVFKEEEELLREEYHKNRVNKMLIDDLHATRMNNKLRLRRSARLACRVQPLAPR
jgi:hypothetical protein